MGGACDEARGINGPRLQRGAMPRKPYPTDVSDEERDFPVLYLALMK